ncbi:MAG: tRNA lysidine(34) synthetase TilS [Gammaproteobacteria bacterium]|nr:MAG: tRNA lysidine(34) synthetase TilS [Gammaproteobacteria bacterium]
MPLARRLQRFFAALTPAPDRCWVAFSGGGDSTALLYLMVELAGDFDWSLGMVHVHHGLLPEAEAWATRARDLASRLHLPVQVFSVQARPRPGESPEAAAREARYAAWRDWLAEGEVIVTAHHADDQAETLLLQLLRGAGPHGLAAMPAVAPLGRGRLVRPLLEVPRGEVRSWARSKGLGWVEDPSNRELRHDRNYLRHQVMPVLEARWPSLARTLHRAAELQAEAAGLLDALAAQDLAVAGEGDRLRVSVLTRLAPARQRNLLRGWIARHGHPLPSRAVLERIRCDLPGARRDAMPCVRWARSEVRRYRDRLYLLEALPDAVPPPVADWDLEPLVFPGLGRTLRLVPAVGQGIAVHCLERGGWSVRFRQGGERIRPAGQAHHRPLKHLLQEAGVPPWERRFLPLVYWKDRLVAVPGICVAEGWQAREAAPGRLPVWG